MTAPTEAEVRRLFDVKLDERDRDSSPSNSLDRAIEGLLHGVLGHGLWERWSCDDDKCPARPAYDVALGELYECIEPLTVECIALIRERLVSLALTFATEYPDAPRSKREVSAVA